MSEYSLGIFYAWLTKADIVIYFDVTRAHLAGPTTSMSPARVDGASSRLHAAALPVPFLIDSRGRWHAAITAARRCVMWDPSCLAR